MMNKIPPMVSVSDVQRSYQAVSQKVKRAKEPVVVLNNGQPDMVLLNVDWYNKHVEQQQKEEEENYLLKLGEEALKEFKEGKSIEMLPSETLVEMLERIDD